MNSRLIIGGVVLVAVVAILLSVNMSTAEAPVGQVCTMDAKLCSDGSYVSRTGPNCEFTLCPSKASCEGGECPTIGILPYESGVKGTVSLGPVCPVMRDPPDPNCADKPYATAIQVYRVGSSSIIATGKSNANGTFEISLPAGRYTISASGGAILPRCSSVEAVVGQSGYVTANISCDTGIR